MPQMVEEFQKEYVFNTFDQLEKRVAEQEKKIAELEQQLKFNSAADLRRNSVDIQTAAKGGNFKAYFDPGAPIEENDILLAETARVFVNSGGVLPEGFSKRIELMACRANEQAQKKQEAPIKEA